MIASTIHVHYNPEAAHERPTWALNNALGDTFGSLRLGSNMTVIIADPATAHLISEAALALALDLQKAQR